MDFVFVAFFPQSIYCNSAAGAFQTCSQKGAAKQLRTLKGRFCDWRGLNVTRASKLLLFIKVISAAFYHYHFTKEFITYSQNNTIKKRGKRRKRIHMNHKEFAKKVQADISDRLGQDYKVCTKEVIKNNGVAMQGLLIHSKGQNVTPTIYLEAFYERYRSGESWNQILDKILTVYRNGIPKEAVNMDFFSDFDRVKGRIVYKLIHAERNAELLAGIPHIRFLDLAICFYYAFSHKTLGNGSILVYNSQMETWKTNTVELLRLAQKNTRRLFGMVLLPMQDLLTELLKGEMDDVSEGDLLDSPKDVSMQILSNRVRMFGAVTMLYPGVLQKLADELQANLYILPSSVHEVILVEDTGEEDILYLKQMVKEVNETQVLPEEILSDSVYYYDREKCEVSCF